MLSSVLYDRSSKIVTTDSKGGFAGVMNSLQNRIKKILSDEGLIPADLARAAGVSAMAVSYWMDGTTKDIKFKYAEPIAAKYGYSARWIMTGKGDMKQPAPESLPDQGSTIDRKVLSEILGAILASDKAEKLDFDPETVALLCVKLYAVYEKTGAIPDINLAIQLEALK